MAEHLWWESLTNMYIDSFIISETALSIGFMVHRCILMRTPRDYLQQIETIKAEEIMSRRAMNPQDVGSLKKEMRLVRSELALLKRNMDLDLYHIRSVYSCRLASDIKRSVIDEIFDESSLTREFEIETREDLKKEKELLLEEYNIPRKRIEELIDRIDSSIPKMKTNQDCQDDSCGRRIVKAKNPY
jgi:hypothetical protein